MRTIWLGLALALTLTRAYAQNAPELSLPLDCELGTNCFIQQLADIDPGPGARDYRCGGATYPGHSGTDLRVVSNKAAEQGVAVLAATAGTVKGSRDGVQDRLMLSAADRALVKNMECGNGMVIDHGGGWVTQYCHLRRGSVEVKQGQTVEAGQRLGLVGYSGEAQFAHLHFEVRHDGKPVDPFSGAPLEGRCLAEEKPAPGLWKLAVRGQLAYPDASIIETGFAGAPVKLAQGETGTIPAATANDPALVFFVRLINLSEGDRLRLSFAGPGDFAVANESKPLDRRKATWIEFAGKKRAAERWPAGEYRGTVEVIRADKVIGTASKAMVFE